MSRRRPETPVPRNARHRVGSEQRKRRERLNRHDPQSGETCDHVTLPAVHLAKRIAADWWPIFGGRDREHSLMPYRADFALSDLRLRLDGATFEVLAAQASEYDAIGSTPNGCGVAK